MEILKRTSLMLAGMAIMLGSCKKKSTVTDVSDAEKGSADLAKKNEAIANISGANGSKAQGTVKFTQVAPETVKIDVTLTGMTEGKHAFHLHENGDCSADDATSAGGHWNPEDNPHGNRLRDDKFHQGDITNLEALENGKVLWSRKVSGWTIGSGKSNDIVNKAVILHARADDFVSQPSGDAGKRVACGVIEEI